MFLFRTFSLFIVFSSFNFNFFFFHLKKKCCLSCLSVFISVHSMICTHTEREEPLQYARTYYQLSCPSVCFSSIRCWKSLNRFEETRREKRKKSGKKSWKMRQIRKSPILLQNRLAIWWRRRRRRRFLML